MRARDALAIWAWALVVGGYIGAWYLVLRVVPLEWSRAIQGFFGY